MIKEIQCTKLQAKNFLLSQVRKMIFKSSTLSLFKIFQNQLEIENIENRKETKNYVTGQSNKMRNILKEPGQRIMAIIESFPYNVGSFLWSRPHRTLTNLSTELPNGHSSEGIQEGLGIILKGVKNWKNTFPMKFIPSVPWVKLTLWNVF